MQSTEYTNRNHDVQQFDIHSSKKSFLELTSDIPFAFYENGADYSFEWYVSYAEILIKTLDSHKIELDQKFQEKNSILDLIVYLESQLSNVQDKYQKMPNYNDEDYFPFSLYIDGDATVKSFYMGFPELQPDWIYVFYINHLNRFRHIALKVAYAKFLEEFLYWTENPQTVDFNHYYFELDRQEDMLDNYQEDEALYETEEQMLLNDLSKKSFTSYRTWLYKYSNMPLSVIENYKPKSELNKKLKHSLIRATELLIQLREVILPCTHESFSDEMPVDQLFRVFPKRDEFSEYEIQAIKMYSQNGVNCYEIIVEFSKSKQSKGRFNKTKELFNELMYHLSFIANYCNDDNYRKN